MYQDGEAHLADERQESGLSLLLDGVVAVAVPSLPAVTPLVVPLPEEEVFIESEGLRNYHCSDDVSTSAPKRLWPLVFLWRLGRLVREESAMFGAVNPTRAPAFVSTPCSVVVCFPAAPQSSYPPPSSSLRSLISDASFLNDLSVCSPLLRMWLSLLFPSPPRCRCRLFLRGSLSRIGG